ncbi:MAG TPA: protein translocase subunit SecD [Ktedonobacterales bacterium]|jgi:preprotein translocase subunit SecD
MRGNTVRSILFLVFILLLGAGAVYVDLPNTPGIHIGGYKNTLEVKRGLDLEGGIQIVLEASCPSDQPKCDITTLLPDALNAVQKRVAGGLSVNDAVVRQQGSNRILVQLPGLQDTQQANELLGQTGKMEIINTNGVGLPVGTVVQPGQYKVVFTGSQLDPNSISATLDQNNQPIVTFEFQGNARSAFATYTRENVGSYLTVTMDGKVIESATIQSEIDGQGEISGLPSVTTAQDLATQLKYGALPLPLAVVSEQQLAATLGQQAIDFSVRAALIGLSLVVLFMLIYYRLPGLLADLALILYALFIFATIKLLGVTLSLPGIAAMVLTIGMAVDANILIFERMKEELRAGRTMASAIDLGFKRAWPSIRDSNASTIITGAILYWFGSNFGATIIVGFATNLIIGVLLSLFTAVVVTRNFLNLLQFSGIATHPALYSLPADALKVSRYNPQTRLASRRAAVITSGAAPAQDAADESEAPLAGVGASANGAAPNANRVADETTGAEE